MVRGAVLVAVAVLLAGCGGAGEPAAGEPVVSEVAVAVDPSPAPTATAELPVTFGLRIDAALTVRNGPGTQFDAIGSLTVTDRVRVECSTTGEPVTDPEGVLVARWDRISSPVTGYISGAFVDSGGVDPDVPACRFVPEAPAQADAAGVFQTVSDGVVRIETATCDGGGVGSGFLIAPDLVATVAHAVEGAASITLRAGDADVTSGTVIGMDSAREVALVRAGQPLTGHVFAFADQAASVGEDVLAVGYPNGDPISLTRGTVSAVGRTVDTGERIMDDLIQTDAAVNPGNSGGPLMDLAGGVVGLVDLLRTDSQGIAYAVSAQTAQPLLADWRANPQPVSAEQTCGAPAGSGDGYVSVEDFSDHPEGPAVGQTMRTWADGISSGDYEASWAMYSQRHRDTQSFREFVDGNVTSLLPQLSIWSIDGAGATGAITANIGFVSVQSPEFGRDGQTCSVWDLNYDLVWEQGAWRIDRAVLFDGNTPEPC